MSLGLGLGLKVQLGLVGSHQPSIQLTTQKHRRNNHGVRSRASLAQAEDPRLGERDLLLKLQVLT